MRLLSPWNEAVSRGPGMRGCLCIQWSKVWSAPRALVVLILTDDVWSAFNCLIWKVLDKWPVLVLSSFSARLGLLSCQDAEMRSVVQYSLLTCQPGGDEITAEFSWQTIAMTAQNDYTTSWRVVVYLLSNLIPRLVR